MALNHQDLRVQETQQKELLKPRIRQATHPAVSYFAWLLTCLLTGLLNIEPTNGATG